MIRIARIGMGKTVFAALLGQLSLCVSGADMLCLPRTEFAKYYERITGAKPTEGLVTLAIDEKVSEKGMDAYAIRSEGKGVQLIGSNLRSVLYAVYDLLERRGGCRWFWDGDVVPKKSAIDLTGLEIREESRFEYRGIRYFAHRGLTRFQAEHWGFEDWKREIDWCVKNRLNLFMLRIGQDDLFQKAFPDVCPYPDPSKPIPEAMRGYNNRSLFWSLQFRGELRKKVMDYAFARGLMAPEDFGTMSHWYSRTPKTFLKKMNPPFLPQQGGSYGEPTDRVWDIRDKKWLDAYWKLTETSIANYGKADILHTIGIAERHCFTNRAKNLKMKCDMLDLLVKNALGHYPDSKVFFAGWDFYSSWQSNEVQQLVKKLDPEKILLWDYEADAYNNTNFTEWNVVGKFPYTFGIFLCYESGLDVRANYRLIGERQKLVEHDPMCKGYILWPESSHTDSICLKYFADNSWKADRNNVNELVSEFCRDRYGDQSQDFESLWLATLPISTNMVGWGGNYGRYIFSALSNSKVAFDYETCKGEFAGYECVSPVFRSLAKLDLSSEFARRDAFDIARTVGDRFVFAFAKRLLRETHAVTNGKASVAIVKKDAALFKRLVTGMSDILELHTDYSLWESLERLNKVRPVENPNFGQVLFDNAVNRYCASHQYEAARYVYEPIAHRFADWIASFVENSSIGSSVLLSLGYRYDDSKPEFKAALERPLESMKPTAERSLENIRAVFNAFAALAEEAVDTEIQIDKVEKPEVQLVKMPCPGTDFPPVGKIMGRDFIPVYKIYEGQIWTNVAKRLGNLPLFTEAALMCVGQNRLGLNKSTRANRFSREYAAPVPESKWRKTPYCFKDLFKKSVTFEELMDGDSDVPFFVQIREARPAHCLEASYPLADVAGYKAWRNTRKNFVGVSTLGEYDNDSRIYSRATIADPATRERLQKAFPPLPPNDQPLERRKAWFEWAKTSLAREQALHFGETNLWPLMCATPGVAHVWCSLGVPGFSYEATMQCATLLPIVSPFARGASRQFRVPYLWYMANYNNVYSRDGSYGPGSHDMRGSKAWRNNPKLGPSPFRGASRSFLDRLGAWGWLGGATFFENEGWGGFHIDDRDGIFKASFYAHDLNDIYMLSKKVDRGVAYAPVALLTPMLDMFGYNGAENCVDQWSQPAFFYTLVPIKSPDPIFTQLKRRGIEAYFVNSPFGAIWDVLCPDAGQKTADFAAALSPYRCAFLVGGGFEKGAVDQKALVEYVKNGGTLFISADQVSGGVISSEIAGVEFGVDTVKAASGIKYPDGTEAATLSEDYSLMLPKPGFSAKPFLKDANGATVAFCRETGKGAVITVAAPRMLPAEWENADRNEYKDRIAGVISGVKRFSLIEFLLRKVQDETMPVSVDGNIQWGLNKTGDGWLLWLMNADGVTKFRGERQQIDISQTSTVRVRMKGKLAEMEVSDAKTGIGVKSCGGAFGVNVLPGEWRIFKFTEKR